MADRLDVFASSRSPTCLPAVASHAPEVVVPGARLPMPRKEWGSQLSFMAALRPRVPEGVKRAAAALLPAGKAPQSDSAQISLASRVLGRSLCEILEPLWVVEVCSF